MNLVERLRGAGAWTNFEAADRIEELESLLDESIDWHTECSINHKDAIRELQDKQIAIHQAENKLSVIALTRASDKIGEMNKQIAKLEGSNNGLDIASDHWERAAKKLQAVVDSHLDWIKIAGGIKCPQCDDSGGWAVDDGHGGCEQEQCQFCYECTDSKFNIQLAAKHATHEGG